MRSRKSSAIPEQTALAWFTPGLMAGVDEAGRGPLAGPVMAAAVILDDKRPIRGLADSKKLTAARRDELFDEINILQATMLAMRRAVEGLRLTPVRVLVDGNRLPTLKVIAEAIVKGDALVPAISAASILAKVTRDRWCAEIDVQYPHYGFATHKGYGTTAHLDALRAHGACPLHRRSFSPVTEALTMGLGYPLRTCAVDDEDAFQ